MEDLPGVDLVGPELVGSLHPRRREWGGPGRGREGARVRQAAKQARRRREREWEEQDGTAAQQHLLLVHGETEPASTDVGFHGAGLAFWRPILSSRS